MPWVLYFSLRQLRAHARHTVPTVLAIAAGTMVMITLFSFSAGLDRYVEHELLSQVPDIYVQPGIAHWLQADLADAVEDVRGVAEAAPYLEVSGLLQRGELAEPVTVRALARQADDGDGAVIGRALANRLYVQEGDVLTLTTALGPWELPVAEIFRTGYYPEDAGVVLVPLPRAQEVWDIPGITGYRVQAEDPSALDRLAGRISDATGLWAQPWYYRHPALYAAWQGQRIAVWVGFGFFVLLVIVGMANFLHQLVFRQTEAMWCLRFLGASPQHLARLVVLQALLLAAAGAALGTGAGGLLVRHYAAFPVSLPDVFYVPELPILWATHRLSWVWLAVMGGSWAGSLYPLLHASQVGLEEVTVHDDRKAR